jgi:hypothetical protein
VLDLGLEMRAGLRLRPIGLDLEDYCFRAFINELGLNIGFHNVDWAYWVAIGLIWFVGLCGSYWA